MTHQPHIEVDQHTETLQIREHLRREMPDIYDTDEHGIYDDDNDSIAPGVGLNAHLIGICVIGGASILAAAAIVIGAVAWAVW